MHKQFTNRLVNETSPYLLQHAHNPVDWFAWGEEALSKAEAEGKIILVSIGYSACHWCHVMERESFEDETVAGIMNAHFVNIKIDREERPDLDHIYMDAVQAMAGNGGWPLNVFLTPGKKPFFGGTYFPPVKAFNRSSWTDVLHGISQAWIERKDEIESQAEYLVEHLQKSNSFSPPDNHIFDVDVEKLITEEQYNEMLSAIMKSADQEWGGFGQAPKFPQTFTIQWLLQFHYFTGNKEALHQALLSIDKMLLGGIYDHVGGGLARYSTDREWLAPHFEKMLYDNALLISVLCDAYQITSAKKYEVAIRKTILFIERELMDISGGFYAALDADSEGEEGKYYVWQKEEVDQELGADAELFCAFYDITTEGNWEGKNIPRILQSVTDFAQERKIGKGKLEEMLRKGLQKLLQRRSTRTRPALDDKIILGWNALLLKAISKAAIILEDKFYLGLAETNFTFLQNNFRTDAVNYELSHTYKDGKVKYPAFLDDYAYLISACLQLYNASLNDKYLENAYNYCRYVIENFSDDESVFFFFTSQYQKDVILRKKEIYDGAVPSGNAVMAENLSRLSIIFDEREWQIRAHKMLKILSPMAVKHPGSFGVWAGLLLQLSTGINEIAIVGTEFASFANNVLLKYIPNMIIMAAAKEDEAFPLLANKPLNDLTLLYLCKNYTCSAPFSHVDSLLEKIDQTNKIREEGTIF